MNKDLLDGKDDVAQFWDEKYAIFNVDEEVDGDLNLVDQDIDLKDKKILIVAVGTGKEVVRAARMGADVYGIDISSNAVKNARAMLQLNSLDGTIIVGDGAETAFESGFFDMVWGSAVLHHLDHETLLISYLRYFLPDCQTLSEQLAPVHGEYRVFEDLVKS